jgi:hypothetical protein
MSSKCGACGKEFRSDSGFDFHRVGQHGVKEGPNRRRCMGNIELRAAGYEPNDKGIWRKALTEEERAAMQSRWAKQEGLKEDPREYKP